MDESKLSPAKIILGGIISLLIIALIANPVRYIQSVYGGLILFATTVLPSLLPFFFFSKALTALGLVSLISDIFRTPMRLLYNAKPCASYIFIMSTLSGYPIGASLCASLYEQGALTYDDVRSIMSFTSASGPLFIIGAVGVGMFHTPKVGYILLISHILGALLNGLIYRQKRTKIGRNSLVSTRSKSTTPKQAQAIATAKPTAAQSIATAKPTQAIDNVLGDIATSTTQNLLLVGCFIAIFSMVIDTLVDIKLIATLANILSVFGVPLDIAQGILISLVEMTRGILVLSESSISLKIIAPIVCFIISFGGLAVTMQSLAFLGKCDIKASRYYLVKLTQALISALICSGVSAIFL